MKAKYVTFFYNKDLLDRIIYQETNKYLTKEIYVQSLKIGDIIKFTGEYRSCLVEVEGIGDKNSNGDYEITVKFIKVVRGELEIDY